MNADTPRKSWLDYTVALIGVLGSVVTIGLTVVNTKTKSDIDAKEQDIKEERLKLDRIIASRSATLEESKEKVERYKWVYGFPALTDSDAVKRNAALAMVRLALEPTEADALLAGLQQSPSSAVRAAATQSRQNLAQIEQAELRRLVDSMNASTSEERKRSTGRLQREYASSPMAVALVLDRLAPPKLSSLNANGLINALYYLSRTEAEAWPQENLDALDKLLPNMKQQVKGEMTRAELGRVETTVSGFRRRS